jgi:ATPase family associated with various cellular activities (AAA)
MPGVFWLGGGSGAGKTTVALAVARRLDLRLYPVDGYTYAHARRAESGGYPLMQAVNEMTPAQRQEGTAAELAERFTAASAERLIMILDDLRALGDGPTVLVEGPQLFPHLVAPLPGSPRHGLWLLPSRFRAAQR